MKNKVVMIFTGGTIAMKVDPELEAAKPGVGSSEIMDMVKEVEKLTEIETIDFGELPSPHMTPKIMLQLSKLVKENIAREDVSGVVITHGTDTLEETAYFLDLTSNSDKAIVLVGSMRNNSELGYDGASNISSAIYTALSPRSKNKGVLVVMNNTIHPASRVSKINTASLDTFKSLESGPLGEISNGEVIFFNDKIDREFIDSDLIEEKVALVKVVAGMDSDILDFYIKKDYKGIVIEALGSGNLPPSMMPGIKRVMDKGIPLILTSRCPTGRVMPVYGYEGGGKVLKDLGLIFAGSQLGHKLRIKLMIALGAGKDLKEIKDIFQGTD